MFPSKRITKGTGEIRCPSFFQKLNLISFCFFDRMLLSISIFIFEAKSMKTTLTQQKRKRIHPVIPGGLILFPAFLCLFSARWFVNIYGRIGFDSILYTLSSSLGGVESDLLIQYLLKALIPALLSTGMLLYLLFRLPRKKMGKYQSAPPSGKGALVLCLVIALTLICIAAFDCELMDYLADQLADTTLYESYFADPDAVAITFPDRKRNLIYIMLESMETSYLSKDLGGAMEENLIPELYALAKDNLCFSDTNAAVGGFHTTAGATWTIGSMVAQTAGIPLKTPTEDVNQYGAEGEPFLPGATTLTNILHDNGYYQALMVGSDVRFGGRKVYFEQHGMDEILDIYTARKDGIIPGDYFVWWGMEDLYLFEYAKQKLTEISAKDQPFAFTMLTVDTHHVGGYQCALCEASTSGETYDQSISCSSRQVAAFVDWIQDQPFYENTTVIIVGDHESMDNGYFQRNVDEGYQRMMYNCFINPAATAKRITNRQWAAVDLFPTTLASLGCTIPGDRLGLGTNLFSGKNTLCEKYGFEAFNDELAKASDYYEANFWN